MLELRVQARASRDHISGLHGERIKVTITAPPVDGKANTHLCRYLSQCFGIAVSRGSLVTGDCSRDQRLRIDQPKRIPLELCPDIRQVLTPSAL